MRYFHPVLIALVVSLSPPAQSQPIADFSGWEVLDKGGRAMPYLGRPSGNLERGIALMPNRTFADGTIDFDVAIHGQSGFAGVVFRSQTPEDYELIYLRTHRSRQWDALHTRRSSATRKRGSSTPAPATTASPSFPPTGGSISAWWWRATCACLSIAPPRRSS